MFMLLLYSGTVRQLMSRWMEMHSRVFNTAERSTVVKRTDDLNSTKVTVSTLLQLNVKLVPIEIKQINAEVTVIWSADVALRPHYVLEPSKHIPSQHSNPVSDDDEIMGFDIEIKKLIRHLTRGISELDVIPTVGMGNKGERLFLERCRIITSLFLTSMFEHGSEGRVEKEEDDDDSILDYDDDEDQEATQTPGLEGRVEEEEDDDDSNLDYDDDEDQEATQAEIEELFGDLVLKEIKQINAKVTVMWSAEATLKPHYMLEPSKHLPSQHSNTVSDYDEIVGFDIATKKLIWNLNRGTSEQDVIPTVGMGEQGKMTIARKLQDENASSTGLTAGSEGGVEEEEDDNDSILDYDDGDEEEESTLAEIEELFVDLGERNRTML
ncbi:hypothetical protein T459_09158 [Capsicum annuum]|uniref:Uncharacterized protein n=1 Tax=Capsicum annuum TaxID=4072 RepID=A0A2G2ZYJ2_CAPAN|nr:hypothetical protein T459_09158 [Capsicum annuum]